MNKMKKVLSSILAFLMVFSLVQMPVKVSAAEASSEAKALAGQLITYYKNYQESAQTDIERVLDEMEAIDAEYAKVWEQIMDYWTVVNTPGFANEDKVPEGLPTDDSLCIVILGFALNSDGTMKDELIGRLQAGLNVANQYPNAYVCVTGGGTASGNPNVTEGGLMGDWLLEQGLDPNRLIRETRAGDTVGNARYTYDILSTTYPTVDKVVIVTSDYHIPRGSVLYNSKFLTEAFATGGRKISVINNSGNETGSNGYETISLQASGVASITGVSAASSVTLSNLVSFTATYVDGTLKVEGNYDSGYVRDVTDLAVIENYDPALGENQLVSISYEENGVSLTTDFSLSQGSVTSSNYRANLAPAVEEARKVAVESLDDISKNIYVHVMERAELIMENEYASEEQIKDVLDALTLVMDNLVKKENIAYGKEVIASHNQAGATVITNGNINDYYESKENGVNIPTTDTELVIDLYNTYNLDAVNVVPYWQTANRYYQYDVFASADNETWNLVAEYRGTDITTAAGQTFTENLDNVRYIKIKGYYTFVDGRSDINNIHINEVFAYGTMVEENPVKVETPKTVKKVVSLGANVTVDSGSNAAVLTDGKFENVYSGSSNGVANAWALIELDEVQTINGVNVVTYSKNTNTYYNWEVLVSTDNEEWTSVGVWNNNSNPGYKGATIEFDDIEAKYVKVKGLSTNNSNGQFHLVEVSVYQMYENIALGKEVTASQGINVANVNDGSLTGFFDSQNLPGGSGADAWNAITPEQRPYLIMNLDGVYTIDAMNVYNYSYGAATSRYYQYEIYTSLDGEEWTLFGAKTDNISSAGFYSISNEPTNARFVKFVETYHSSNSGFHIIEWNMNGTKAEEEPADFTAINEAIERVGNIDAEYLSLTSIVSVVVEGAKGMRMMESGISAFYQAEVDACAAAINEEIDSVTNAPADYTEVNKAIAKAKAEKPYIIDYSGVQEALNEVVTGKDATEQELVDFMANGINGALANAEYAPKPIENFVATGVDYKTIELTWDADANADKYVVERLNKNTGLWITLGTTNETSFVASGVKAGKEYTYRVKAVRTFEGVEFEGAYVETKGVTTLFGSPELTISKASDTVFNLSWTKVAGATRYILYRKDGEGAWKKVRTFGGDVAGYTTISMRAGTYSYQVKAARYDGAQRIMTEGSNVVTETSGTLAPIVTRADKNESTLTIEWDKVDGYKYYEVYFGTNGTTRRVKVTTGNVAVVKNLKAGNTYEIQVRGYVKVNDQTIYTPFSDVRYVSFE